MTAPVFEEMNPTGETPVDDRRTIVVIGNGMVGLRFCEKLIAADPERSTANAVRTTSLPSSSEAIDIVGIGKAAVPMVLGAISALPGCTVRVFVLTKDDHGLGQTDPAWSVRYGAHPVLEQRNIDATNELLAWLAAGDAAPVTLCLVSGGGSALLERPYDGISLSDFQTITRLLLPAGADITELNTVRSCLSQVKGGGLRSFVRSPRCISLLLSDVLGNDPAIIASGPTIASQQDPEEALAILARFGLIAKAPQSVLGRLHQVHSSQSVGRLDDQIAIIADNSSAVEAAWTALQKSGYNAAIGECEMTGEASDHARAWVEMLTTMPTEIDAVVGGGELTVTVRGNGQGGRNTEFALAAAIALCERGLDDWTVGSLATDGQDALTGVAGAIVSAATVAFFRDLGGDPEKELATNNSFPCLEQVGATVHTGPTGTNVNDCYFAVRTRLA